MTNYAPKPNDNLSDQETVCIILAAGKSQRFGSAKMLHRMPNDLTILENSIAPYIQVFDNASVVIGPADEKLKKILKKWPVTVIESLRTEEGLSQSLVSGVQANKNNKGYLIGLGDMPYIRTSTLQSLKQKIDQATASNIVAMRMNERIGNPVWFGGKYTQDLLNLSGDKGAKGVLKANLKNVKALTVSDSGIFNDIDTPADLI